MPSPILEGFMRFVVLAWVAVCAIALVKLVWLMLDSSRGLARARETLARSLGAGAAPAPTPPPAPPLRIEIRADCSELTRAVDRLTEALDEWEFDDGEEWKHAETDAAPAPPILHRRPSPPLDDRASWVLLQEIFVERGQEERGA